LKARLIFPGKHGGTNGHALRLVKQLALRAGVNCGLCVNKAGKSCTKHQYHFVMAALDLARAALLAHAEQIYS
jgi:integrase/recombinase XerD